MSTPLKLFDLRITIILEAPFLFAGNEPPFFGVDIPQIRNRFGAPIIPDSHIKGVLRHACMELGSLKGFDLDVPTLFGSKTNDIGEDGKGLASFSDLVAKIDQADVPTTRTVTRVSIDDTTRTAKAGHLLSVEQVVGAGKEIEFSGLCHLIAKDEGEATDVTSIFDEALRLVPAMGRFKTVGFGRLVSAKIDIEDPAAGSAHAAVGQCRPVRTDLWSFKAFFGRY